MNKGFSLVELIVVIAIMAILVGVAVPVYTSYIGKANEAADVQAIDNLEHACKIVGIEYGVKITFSDGGEAKIVASVEKATNTSDADLAAAVAQLQEILGSDATYTAASGSAPATFTVDLSIVPSASATDKVEVPNAING